MNNQDRINNYVRILKWKTVDGYYRLTPKQRRRAEHKFRKANKNKTVPFRIG